MANIQNGNELINVNVFEMAGVEDGMVVGDLGCGNIGFFALSSAKLVGKKGIVYAVDILKSALKAVESRAKHEGLENLKLIWSNLEIFGATKIPENSLDVAFIHNVFFQAKNSDSIIKESQRLMKPQSKLMIIDWLKVGASFGPPVTERIDPEEIKKYALAENLEMVKEFVAGPYHFGLLFQKQ